MQYTHSTYGFLIAYTLIYVHMPRRFMHSRLHGNTEHASAHLLGKDLTMKRWKIH